MTLFRKDQRLEHQTMKNADKQSHSSLRVQDVYEQSDILFEYITPIGSGEEFFLSKQDISKIKAKTF